MCIHVGKCERGSRPRGGSRRGGCALAMAHGISFSALLSKEGGHSGGIGEEVLQNRKMKLQSTKTRVLGRRSVDKSECLRATAFLF
jgi:hypothetical protein